MELNLTLFLLWSCMLLNMYNCLRNNQEIFSGKTNKVLHMDKFLEDCPDIVRKSVRTATQYYNVSHIITKSGFMLINYRLRVYKDLLDAMTLKMIIQRCASREAPDTCIRFTTFSTDKVCAFISSKNDVWSTLLSCMKPGISCPIHKGEYIGTNCTLNMQAFNWFPTGNSYWKIRGELITKKKEMIGCLINEGFVKTAL